MIMIPLIFVVSLIAIAAALREWTQFEKTERNTAFIVFLLSVAVQTIIVGVHFGYGASWLGIVQPITAALLPPLAYLSFSSYRPWKLVLLLVPPILTLTGLLLLPPAVDGLLALNNIVFAVLLIRQGLCGGDGLVWADMNRIRVWLYLLWIIAAHMLLAGMIDGVIILDFIVTQGENMSGILAVASVLGVFGAVAALAVVLFSRKSASTTRSNSSEEDYIEIFNDIEQRMVVDRLFVDPDINLTRLARRLSLPVRDVSRAINSQAGTNVSQYINALRVHEACRLMSEDKLAVTAAIYGSGFNTKSNFNREFLRVIGQSPSDWRKANNRQ